MATRAPRIWIAAGLSLALLATAMGLAQDAPRGPGGPDGPGRGAPGQGAPGQGAPGQGAPGRGRGAGGPASVEQAMNGMGRALRALKDTLADASKKDENLRAINDMQRNCVAAKGMHLPSEIHKEVTDPAARAKLATEFRQDLITLLRQLIDLEQSVMNGKADQAKTQLEAIIALRDKSHDQMGVKDEEKGPPPAPPRSPGS